MTVEEILAALQAIIDGAKAEDGSDRSLTEEEVARYEALEGQLRAVQKSDELIKRNAAYTAVSGRPAPKAKPVEDDEISRSFDQYMRTGVADQVIQRAQSEGIGSAGGFMVPEGFRNKIVERMKEFGGLANAAEILTTDSGQPLPWVTNDDTANEGEIVNEGATFASGADLVLGTRALGAYKYMAGGAGNLPLKVSYELIQDSAFDVASFVARKLGERLARKQAEHWITGTGVNEPVGLLSTAGGITNSGVTIASNAVGPDYEDLIDIIHALDPAYRAAGGAWLFNDAVLAKIRKLVDLDGRPLLWNANGNLGAGPEGMTLLGYPVIVDQDAPAPAASNRFMAFGNFREAYVIRRVKAMQLVTLNELYAPNGQVGYFGWERADGMVQDANAAVYVTAAA